MHRTPRFLVRGITTNGRRPAAEWGTPRCLTYFRPTVGGGPRSAAALRSRRRGADNEPVWEGGRLFTRLFTRGGNRRRGNRQSSLTRRSRRARRRKRTSTRP